MSVSMLLNAANVVTAAERCHAIDEKTGRIPINMLLSRSTDLDDAVKDQLQQLAVTSPSISILPPASHPPAAAPAHASQVPSDNVSDACMVDVPASPHRFPHLHPHQQHHRRRHDHRHQQHQQHPHARMHMHHQPHHNHPHQHHQHLHDDQSHHHVATDEDEEEALKDIDRETSRPDRNTIRRNQKRNQTLTRKAIRKHTGGTSGKRTGAKDHSNDHGMDSSSSTMNTVVGSDCMQSSVASSASQHSNTPRRRWKEWEDELLMQVVADHGPTKWNSLARHFPGRNGRQVRLRWMNHLQPSLDKRPWRPEEDAVLLAAHNDLGNKWALISMRLGGRTDNSVKNRYKSIVRRNAREAKAARKQE